MTDDGKQSLQDATCAPTCGKWTDPSSRAYFDLLPICGQKLTIADQGGFEYTLNICGKIQCSGAAAGEGDGGKFCAVEKDSVCGIDGEALREGMIVRNSNQTCGAVTKCERCDILARTTDGTMEYSLMEESPFRGVSMRLPPVQLTSAQRDQTDQLGYCVGEAGRVAHIDFFCDCKLTDQVAILEQVSQESTTSCLTKFNVKSRFACYEGFCDGLPPPALQSGGNGWLIAIVLILLVVAFLVVVKKRGYQHLLGLTERFSRPAYAGLTTRTATSGLELGEDEGL